MDTPQPHLPHHPLTTGAGSGIKLPSSLKNAIISDIAEAPDTPSSSRPLSPNLSPSRPSSLKSTHSTKRPQTPQSQLHHLSTLDDKRNSSLAEEETVMAPGGTTEDPTADGTNPTMGSHTGSGTAAAGSAVPTGGQGAAPPGQQGSGPGAGGPQPQSDPPYVRDLNVHSLLTEKLGPGMMIKQGLVTGVEVEDDGWVSVVLRGRWVPGPQS